MLNDFLIDATTWRDASFDRVGDWIDGPRREVDDHKWGNFSIEKKWELSLFLYDNEYRKEIKNKAVLKLKLISLN